MSNRVPLKDLLRDRGLIDQWGFMVFAVVGFAGIISAKWLSAETVWVAIGAVLAMLCYAAIVGSSGTGRLRADQAGDNCYYLGLIYTLASLSYAIGTFDPNNTASTIVQGFGIALATTIFGLILRVFFSQGRPDLENIEGEVRLELTAAASRLKSELNGVVQNMNDFGRLLQQSIDERHTAAAASLDECTKNAIESLKSVADTASEAIRHEANDFAARSKRYSTTFDKLLSKLDQHSAAIEQINQAHNALSATANLVQGMAESASASIGALSKSAEAASIAASSAEGTSKSAKILVEQLVTTVPGLQASLLSIREQTDRQIDQLKRGPAETVTNAVASLSLASQALEAHLAELGKLHSDVRVSLAAQSEAALKTSKQHNDKLEMELDRSRELVNRVHSSLATMTDKLARTVEGVA